MQLQHSISEKQESTARRPKTEGEMRTASDFRGASEGLLVEPAGAAVDLESEDPTLENPGLSLGDVPAPKFTLGTGVGADSTDKEETIDTVADGDMTGSELDEPLEEDESGGEVEELVDAFVAETPETP